MEPRSLMYSKESSGPSMLTEETSISILAGEEN